MLLFAHLALTLCFSAVRLALILSCRAQRHDREYGLTDSCLDGRMLCDETVVGGLCEQTVVGRLCEQTVVGRLCEQTVVGGLCEQTVAGRTMVASTSGGHTSGW